MQQAPDQWLRILESCCAIQKTTYASHSWLIKWTNTLFVHKFEFTFYVFALLVSLAPYKFEISLSATHIRDFVRDCKMNMNHFRLLELHKSVKWLPLRCNARRNKVAWTTLQERILQDNNSLHCCCALFLVSVKVSVWVGWNLNYTIHISTFGGKQ